jgi:hypothetical protein
VPGASPLELTATERVAGSGAEEPKLFRANQLGIGVTASKKAEIAVVEVPTASSNDCVAGGGPP